MTKARDDALYFPWAKYCHDMLQLLSCGCSRGLWEPKCLHNIIIDSESTNKKEAKEATEAKGANRQRKQEQQRVQRKTRRKASKRCQRNQQKKLRKQKEQRKEQQKQRSHRSQGRLRKAPAHGKPVLRRQNRRPASRRLHISSAPLLLTRRPSVCASLRMTPLFSLTRPSRSAFATATASGRM